MAGEKKTMRCRAWGSRRRKGSGCCPFPAGSLHGGEQGLVCRQSGTRGCVVVNTCLGGNDCIAQKRIMA